MTSQIAVASDTLIASLKNGKPITDLNEIFPEGDIVQTSALRGTIMYSIVRAHSGRIHARLFELSKRAVRPADMCKSLILLSNGKLKYLTYSTLEINVISLQSMTLPPTLTLPACPAKR